MNYKNIINRNFISQGYRISIRTKLFVVSLVLLVIPIIGYHSIQDLENYLRQQQELDLLEYARFIAESVKDSEDLFPTDTINPSTTKNNAHNTRNHLFIRSLRSSVQIDGYSGDWALYQDRKQSYKNNNDLAFTFQIGHYQRYLYAYFEILDKDVVYRKPNSNAITRNDHIMLGLETSAGKFNKYVISTYSPGIVNAQKILSKTKNNIRYKSDDRIRAAWITNDSGYNVELRIPISLVGGRIAINVFDVDDINTRQVASSINVTGQDRQNATSTIVVAPQSIESLLNRLRRHSTRIWVTDSQSRVLAIAGSLTDNNIETGIDQEPLELSFGEFISGVVRLIYQVILKQPAKQFRDDLSNASFLKGTEIDSSLNGDPATQWRQTPDEQVNILTAAHPIRIDNRIIGSVAIEETSNSILILQNRAFKILLNLSIITFVIATMTLLIFASRLSFRISRLRDDSEKAISEDGKVLDIDIASNSHDEIGDLSRSISGMLMRLSQYNKYLETMASKLAHELRTPITVIKSSLENLETSRLNNDAATYIDRAKEGADRLSRILTRMSEATRLEQTLQNEEIETFNIEDVISSCIQGYRSTNPHQKFLLDVKKDTDKALIVLGVPDLIAQLLDKLISNAQDFSPSDKPIECRIEHTDKEIMLYVSNEGPVLADEITSNLFDSMVSSREKKDKEPHLGLGLYIVRLITEFHNGKVTAYNRDNPAGVTFRVTLPLRNS